jgi:hypothetical protein
VVSRLSPFGELLLMTGKSTAYRIVAAQLGATILVAGGVFLIWGAAPALAIAWWRLAALPLLAGYASTLLIYWLALLPSVPTIKVDRA